MFPLVPSSSFFPFLQVWIKNSTIDKKCQMFDSFLRESRKERKENNNMSLPLMSFQPTSHCYEQGRGTGSAIVLVHIMSMRFVDVKQNINTQ